MNPKVFLIHGWSTTETTSYQALHLKIAEEGFQVEDIYLGRYVSLENNVEIRDLSKAMHKALLEKLDGDWQNPFHLVTHSTGALIVKYWISKYYQQEYAENQPLQNIIFLAPPHFGSRLAHHGRSMLAHAKYLGDTGKRILNALELGSDFSWYINERWLDNTTWIDKGIRPFSLIGDKVAGNYFASKIMPARYEQGSDMVVRCAAGNLNFRRYELNGKNGTAEEIGRISDVPFGALADFTHDGYEYGIMNCIRKKSTPDNNLSLKLILECLMVNSPSTYDEARQNLTAVTAETRKKRKAFAQLDFRFRDEDGRPVDDYLFKLGMIVNGRERPSRAVIQVHKNRITPNHFTVFIDMKQLDSQYLHFMHFDSSSDSYLFSYQPDPFRVEVTAQRISELISPDQTTQFDVVLSREPSENLFVFHPGNYPDLHVRWNRRGDITRKNLRIR